MFAVILMQRTALYTWVQILVKIARFLKCLEWFIRWNKKVRRREWLSRKAEDVELRRAKKKKSRFFHQKILLIQCHCN